MPVKSKLGNGPSSGSSDRNRTAAGVSRNASARQQYSSNSIITEREERASVAIATNLPFSEWGTVFPDPRLVAAIVDRVTFNAHIIETGTQSYRLRTSKTSTRRKRASRQTGGIICADFWGQIT